MNRSRPMRTKARYVLGAILCLVMAGCGGTDSAPSNLAPASEPQAGETRTYHLEGTIISVDKANQSVTVDHKEIPGFMAAMAMPYPVAAAGDPMLDQLAPGDQITADVEADDTGARLRNIIIVKKGEGAK